VKNANFAYTPTSANVAAARVQIVITGNSGITGYMDNIEMFSPVAGAEDPTPTILGDLNSDGMVNDDDAAVLFTNWGQAADGSTTVLGDINHDGTVNDDDAAVLF